MSYAIIRNVKYKRENLKGMYRHNERKNYNYSNRNIDKEKSYLNYSIKDPMYSYEKEFDRLKEKYGLKSEIKTVSNIACEYKNKSIELEFKYNDKYERLENENNKLLDIIDRFYTTIVLFIKWVCNKFALGDSRKIIRDFERENNICTDPVKQIASEQGDEEEM